MYKKRSNEVMELPDRKERDHIIVISKCNIYKSEANFNNYVYVRNHD